MTNTYNTGNSLGSTDPRDLYDNASNFDEGMNRSGPTFTDRLGNLRKTWNGMETEFDLAQAGRVAEFQAFLVASGYVSLGNYAAGLNFTAYNQYMARDGFFYRPAPSSVPFTTTGTWAGGDENLFVLMSEDAVLRQDLFQDTGASLVRWKGKTVGEAIDGLLLVEADSTGATDATAIIQAALAASDVVTLPAGSFKISGTIQMKDKNVLRGMGSSATRVFRDTSVPAFDFFEGKSVSDVTVSGIFFDSVNKLPITVADNHHCALRFWDDGTAVRSKRVTVSGCRFEKFTAAEIQPGGNRGVVAVDECDEVDVLNNVFYDNRATCVFYFDSANIRVGFNECTGEQAPYDLVFQPTQGVGSFVSGGGEGQTVIGNRIKQTGYSSLNCGGNGVTITGNTISDPSYAGIGINESHPVPATNVTISGNSIKGAKLAGLYLWNVDGYTVSGNHIEGCGVTGGVGGIRLSKASAFPSSQNGIISGNNIFNNIGPGLRINACGKVSIKGNRISFNSTNGIAIDPNTSGATVDAVITGNDFIDNTLDAISSSTSPASASTLWVDGNTFISSNTASLQPTGLVVNGNLSTWNVGRNSFSNTYDTNYVETSFGSKAGKAVLLINSAILNRMKLLDSVNYVRSTTYDPASIGAGAGLTTTVTVPGAAVGDLVQVSFSNDLQGITLTGWVSAANTVSARFQNGTGAPIDLASGTLTARVVKL